MYNSYCEYSKELPDDNPHKIYHDTVYGFRTEDDNELFGRLILEISQAGLSWDTVLKKQKYIKVAFDNFEIQKIANFDELKISSLLQDTNIIRNLKKIHAVIYNAKVVMKLKKDFGSFKNWLDQQKAVSIDEWVNIFKTNFKFVGKKIVEEFLVSTGYIPGAHIKDCWVYEKLQKN
ncbi:DNA-3-methyladenine glycosylase I [Candidatus Dojkabacteria bacterium]|uniref:DNA-3-methyladenine glycosylase I n=1 Tax=Candidatus Dojkabacteria bacterium TaxID=2099670 RepID=A0A3M0YXU6_9BACT|nr:MAG: DNA-3-methyladenine glycosylase I [Candidatus Dojkabacteria bacterium]